MLPEANQEQAVLGDLRRQRRRMHPLTATAERLDDLLDIAIKSAQRRLGFSLGDVDDPSKWAPLVGSLVIAAAMLVKDHGELE
jgi:hypothetical protein